MHREADAPNHIGAKFVAVPLQSKDFLEETKVWLDAKEGFAKSNEKRKMEDRIGRQLPELNAVREQDPTEKFMGREGKTANEEISKHHRVSGWRRGTGLVPITSALLFH